MRNNSKSAMLSMLSLLESRNWLLHFWTSLEGKWSQLKCSSMANGRFLNRETTLSKKSDLEVLGMWKLKHRKSISQPTMLEGDVSRRNLKGFTIVSEKTQHIVIRTSSKLKLAGLKRRALRWTNQHRKITPFVQCLKVRQISEELFFTLNKSGRNATMKLRSDFREALTNMHRVHRESGEELPEQIPLYQYQRWHSSSSSSSTSWWQWNEHWWSSYIKDCQLPLSSCNEQPQRTGKLVLDAYSSRNAEWIFFNKIFNLL